MNRFRTDLAFSHSQSDQPWWGEVYRNAFPTMSTMADVRADGWAQRGGIDRQVILRDGTVIKVDEKVRRTSYDDILLERWADRDRKVPGWVQKPLTCDFIAYAFATTGVCYLLPFQLLRRAWRQHGPDWIASYPPVLAENPSYVTESVPVPTMVLLDAIAGAMVVYFQPEKATA